MLKSLKKVFSLFNLKSKTGWVKGTITGYTYCIKAYQNSSEFGINGGKISKLEIWKDGILLVNYDRDWDIQPSTIELAEIVKKLLLKFDPSKEYLSRVAAI